MRKTTVCIMTMLLTSALLMGQSVFAVSPAVELCFSNSDFNKGTWENWTVTGNAFGSTPRMDTGFPVMHGTVSVADPSPSRSYCASSGVDVAGIGDLKSMTFTMKTKRIRFLLAGSGTPIDQVRVELYTADGTDVAWAYFSLPAADSQDWHTVAYLDVDDSIVGKQVYIRVIDESPEYWIAVDDFMFVNPPVAGELFNGDFETGDLSGWTVIDGMAFTPYDNVRNPVYCGDPYYPEQSAKVYGHDWVNSFRLTSICNGETAVGIIRSQNFKVTAPYLKFLISGYIDAPGGTEEHNYVQVFTQDGTPISDKVRPSGNNFMISKIIDLSAYLNQIVYIEVVDDAPGAGYAWMAVDAFRLDAQLTPNRSIINGDFEAGTYEHWMTDGAAFGSTPAAKDSNGSEGNFFATTKPAGDSAVGTLTSEQFTITSTQVEFLISGYSGSGKNYVSLVDAISFKEISRTAAPDKDQMQKITLQLPDAIVGQAAYLIVVDGNNAASQGWIAVDSFNILAPYLGDPDIPNSSFETGDLTGWTATGTAFNTNPVKEKNYGFGDMVGWKGYWYVNTMEAGETAVGRLKSNNFELKQRYISFRIGGHSGRPEARNELTYVRLVLADGTEIGREYAPNTNALQVKTFDVGEANIGKQAYIEIVDENNDSAFAWVSADDFIFTNQFSPHRAIENPGFELGTYVNWRSIGEAFGTKPVAKDAAMGNDGNYFASTKADPSKKGTLRSDYFVALGTALTLKLAGTDSANCYVSIYSYDTGKVIASTPVASATMQTVTIPLTGYASKLIYIEIVDESTTGWIAADSFAYAPPADAGDPDIPNGDFEYTDLRGWVSDGLPAFYNCQPVPADFNANMINAHNDWYVNSFIAGETSIGSLRSEPFDLKYQYIQFMMGGFSQTRIDSTVEGYAETDNYITLNLAETEEMIEMIRPGYGNRYHLAQLDGMSPRVFDGGSGNVGQKVYIEIVDNASEAGFAWISVDNFRFVRPNSDADKTIVNPSFESGNYTGWTASGTAFGSNPVRIDKSEGLGDICEGIFCVNSRIAGGNTATGTLRSANFSLQSVTIDFLANGFNRRNETLEPRDNYIRLVQVDGNVELARVEPPNVNELTPAKFTAPASALGTQVYIEVVDNSPEEDFAWIGVDNFKHGSSSSTNDAHLWNLFN